MALTDQIGRYNYFLVLLSLFSRTERHECGNFQIRGASLDICELFLGDIDEVPVPLFDFGQVIGLNHWRHIVLQVIAVRYHFLDGLCGKGYSDRRLLGGGPFCHGHLVQRDIFPAILGWGRPAMAVLAVTGALAILGLRNLNRNGLYHFIGRLRCLLCLCWLWLNQFHRLSLGR